MTTGRRIVISLLVTVAVWLIFTWPLAKYFTGGIPASHNSEEITVQSMIPGDHLQLLYHFWLTGDMMAGNTPWFTNLYEFNIGDDEERFELTYNFFPFSIICAVLSWLGGQAFGWNMTAFFSLWITYLFTWVLTRRYTNHEAVAAVSALFGIMLTYRWFALMGGSPTGFAMMWTPLLMLGLDIAVRESRVSGGVLAGITLFCAGISDTHVYFFLTLFTPVWCISAFLMRGDFDWKSWKAYKSLGLALLPVALLGGASILKSTLLARELADSIMAHGRRLGEVAGFSPKPEGLFSLVHQDVHSQVYIGYSAAIVILLGFVIFLVKCLSRHGEWRRTALFFSFIIAAISGVAILALGPHGPSDARMFIMAREWIPPYAMIRQSGKIFSIMPQLIAVAAALGLTALITDMNSKLIRHGILILFAGVMTFEYSLFVKPKISLLNDEQPAYAAVANDARDQGRDPHVLVVVLWPGDSHYASVYEHYISKYRIRMVNGYRPAVPQQYRDEVFWRYHSINQGHLTEDQADSLLEMGVRYILVHENLFPEQVSPFPVTFTIRKFLNNPRLEWMKQADHVWAFRILEESEDREDQAPNWNTWFPARLWEFEMSRHHEADAVEDPECSGYGYLSLNREEAAVLLHHTSAPPAPEMRWMIRARGDGRLRSINLSRDDLLEEDVITVQSKEWTWIEFPLNIDKQSRVSLRLEYIEGKVDLDMALLTAGEWSAPAPGNPAILPAPLFFHAGYTDHENLTLVFSPETEPIRRILYGPRLPLNTGRHEITLDYTSGAPYGTRLGSIRIESAGEMDEEKIFPVMAGEPFKIKLTRNSNLPFTLSFDYARKAGMEIESVTIRRLED